MDYEQEFIRKFKTAGVKDLVKRHPSIAAGLGGAAAAAIGQHLMNRKGKDGTSFEQRHQKKNLEGAKETIKEEGPTFGSKIKLVNAKSQNELANVLTEHPYRGALLAAPAGAAAGVGVLNAIKHLSKLAK